MARVDYFAIQEAIKTVLEADQTIADAHIALEEELEFNQQNHILIYLMDRDAPENRQTLSGGTRTKFLINFSIWCFAYHMSELKEAMRRRDDLIGKVEIALMKNRSLGGVVDGSWITGGEFANASQEGSASLFAGGEIRLTTEQTAITE